LLKDFLIYRQLADCDTNLRSGRTFALTVRRSGDLNLYALRPDWSIQSRVIRLRIHVTSNSLTR